MNGGAVTLLYDGDGNRVAKTVAAATTRYLVDDLNPTGYAQVVEELVGGSVQRTYTSGLQRTSQNQLIGSTWTPSFYGYDGFGSVRTLTDSARAVTDTFDYDAWGNVVNTTGSTPNVYLYRGEQYDPDLGLYYLRARYFNPLTGRFLSRDPKKSSLGRPKTLHKYLYASSNPVNRKDASGRMDYEEYILPIVMICGGSGYCGLSPGQVIGAATLVGVVGSWIMHIWAEADEKLENALPPELPHVPEDPDPDPNPSPQAPPSSPGGPPPPPGPGLPLLPIEPAVP